MKKRWLVAIIPGVLAAAAFALLLALFLIKLLWSWTIPDIFPGAVSQGLIVGEISWLTSFKIAIFVAFMSALTGIRNEQYSAEHSTDRK